LKKLLFALSASLFAGATPALAAPDSASWLMTDARFASVHVPHYRAITSKSVLIPGFVTATPNESGLPCIDCVNSSDQPNTLGLSIPDDYIASGVSTNYFFNFTALSYNGTCRERWRRFSGHETGHSYVMNSASIRSLPAGSARPSGNTSVLADVKASRATLAAYAALTSPARRSFSSDPGRASVAA
jgi:hypothetical protein